VEVKKEKENFLTRF